MKGCEGSIKFITVKSDDDIFSFFRVLLNSTVEASRVVQYSRGQEMMEGGGRNRSRKLHQPGSNTHCPYEHYRLTCHRNCDRPWT